jgi:hypothetical protein
MGHPNLTIELPTASQRHDVVKVEFLPVLHDKMAQRAERSDCFGQQLCTAFAMLLTVPTLGSRATRISSTDSIRFPPPSFGLG